MENVLIKRGGVKKRKKGRAAAGRLRSEEGGGLWKWLMQGGLYRQ